jgi:predicted TIM-barrel fold metal-dependent hydrolase
VPVATMIVDCHVHTCADTPGHGSVSRQLRKGIIFRFMRWRLGLPSEDGAVLEQALEQKLVETVRGAEKLDAAVVLAFDAVYTPQGRRDEDNTHLYVSNDYVAELTGRFPNLLFGASVHPYRRDAVAELERCVARGAVLLKWLPIVQDFDPSDARCLPFYEALAHHKLPLLCHTGGEQTLPNLNTAVADPMLLLPALQRGVTVIAAHCGTQSRPLETDYLPTFMRMAREHENLYGDTSALDMPTRSYAFGPLLKDRDVNRKLVHGSDWPVISVPPRRIGWRRALRLLFNEGNWMRRDVIAKQELGFDDAYWHRAATLLRMPAPAVSAVQPTL